jgi:hypothetical protein
MDAALCAIFAPVACLSITKQPTLQTGWFLALARDDHALQKAHYQRKR